MKLKLSEKGKTLVIVYYDKQMSKKTVNKS